MSRRLETPAGTASSREAPDAPRMGSVEFFLVADHRSGAAVEDELTRLDGVRYAQVDADRLHVRVTYDPGVISPGRLLAASKAAGRRPGPAARDGRPPPKAAVKKSTGDQAAQERTAVESALLGRGE